MLLEFVFDGKVKSYLNEKIFVCVEFLVFICVLVWCLSVVDEVS